MSMCSKPVHIFNLTKFERFAAARFNLWEFRWFPWDLNVRAAAAAALLGLRAFVVGLVAVRASFAWQCDATIMETIRGEHKARHSGGKTLSFNFFSNNIVVSQAAVPMLHEIGTLVVTVVKCS